MFVVTASASQTGRHALRPSAIEATYMYQRKKPLSLFVLLFFRLSFSFLLPSFVPRATSFLLFTPCQPFSFPFFSLFAQPYTDNRWDNEYTIASSFLLLLTPSVTLPPSVAFIFLPCFPYLADTPSLTFRLFAASCNVTHEVKSFCTYVPHSLQADILHFITLFFSCGIFY